MTKPPAVRAVILAAGRGSRFSGHRADPDAPSLPKQFQDLAGRPVALHSLTAIASLPAVVEVAVVLPDVDLPDALRRQLADPPHGDGSVSIRLVTGGLRRQDSVIAGLEAFSGPCDVALVHDAARPFPPRRALDSLVSRCLELGGALLAVPISDTVKLADRDLLVDSTLDREKLWLAQTPQAMRGELIERLLGLLRGEAEYTDESAALESLGVPVGLVEGAATNLKITGPEDLRRAEALLQNNLV